MSEGTALIEADLSEARASSRDVREQLRTLEETLRALAVDVTGMTHVSSPAIERLERARLNVTRAIEELLCTDTSQMPF
jgi:hypothetical protein